MLIVWDQPKRDLNIEKYGLDFADLTLAFFDTALVLPAHSARYRAIGLHEGVLLVAVIFRPLGSEALAVVSMRRASTAERRLYDAARQN